MQHFMSYGRKYETSRTAGQSNNVYSIFIINSDMVQDKFDSYSKISNLRN